MNNGNASQQIVNKAWSFAHVLRDDGLSYMAYTEQITFLLFLKMIDERARLLPGNKHPIPVGPKGRRYDWQALLAAEGEALETQYRETLEFLARQPGMLGEIFKK
ncbi:MAG: SAM-dependent DNA methyltransferase, partial [Anaerolineae bacterium]|nr:SAM-dependent DNA methyltransferase [Anaerolineae bacterium]